MKLITDVAAAKDPLPYRELLLKLKRHLARGTVLHCDAACRGVLRGSGTRPATALHRKSAYVSISRLGIYSDSMD